MFADEFGLVERVVRSRDGVGWGVCFGHFGRMQILIGVVQMRAIFVQAGIDDNVGNDAFCQDFAAAQADRGDGDAELFACAKREILVEARLAGGRPAGRRDFGPGQGPTSASRNTAASASAAPVVRELTRMATGTRMASAFLVARAEPVCQSSSGRSELRKQSATLAAAS